MPAERDEMDEVVVMDPDEADPFPAPAEEPSSTSPAAPWGLEPLCAREPDEDDEDDEEMDDFLYDDEDDDLDDDFDEDLDEELDGDLDEGVEEEEDDF